MRRLPTPTELSKPTLPLGVDCKNKAVSLAPKWLDTHLHLIGPPGTGKTRLMLWIFQQLARAPRATVILMNPKGDLCHLARDWAIGAGQTKRLVLFDTSDERVVLGYNPMRRNGLPIETQAKAVREGIRSAFGQSSFDSTPQMARLLYLTLTAALTCGLNLVDAVTFLRSGSSLRKQILTKVDDPFLRESIEWFESLKPSRQEELAASSLARLESFVGDRRIRRILTQEASLDFGSIMNEHKLLLVNLELYRPLRADDVRMLGRLLVNDIVANVFARPSGARGPVYLLIDEVQNFLTADLCAALDMGRELGLHCVLAHQNLGQLRKEDAGGDLYSSVMGSTRAKFVFGGLNEEDLQIIARETMLEEFNPYAVKDVIESLELEPVESSRTVITRGTSRSRTVGTSHSASRSTTTGGTRGSSLFGGWSSGKTRLSGEDEDHSRHSGWNVGGGLSWGHSTGETEGTSDGMSASETAGESETVTETPYTEYIKSRKVSSRTFFTEQEFLRMAITKLKLQGRGEFMVKVPGVRPNFLRAHWVSNEKLRSSDRELALAQVYSQPFYRPIRDILEEEARSAQPPTEIRQSKSPRSKTNKRDRGAAPGDATDDLDGLLH
jgi:hypothetical protein